MLNVKYNLNEYLDKYDIGSSIYHMYCSSFIIRVQKSRQAPVSYSEWSSIGPPNNQAACYKCAMVLGAFPQCSGAAAVVRRRWTPHCTSQANAPRPLQLQPVVPCATTAPTSGQTTGVLSI